MEVTPYHVTHKSSGLDLGLADCVQSHRQPGLSPRALAGYITEPYSSTMPLSHGQSRNTVRAETGVTRVIHYLSFPSRESDAGPERGKAGADISFRALIRDKSPEPDPCLAIPQFLQEPCFLPRNHHNTRGQNPLDTPPGPSASCLHGISTPSRHLLTWMEPGTHGS